MTLKRKITEMEVATSLSLARMTGAVAAIADPPQMDEPTPTRVAVFEGNLRILAIKNAITSEVVIVDKIISREFPPTSRTVIKFIPKPRKTMLVCNIFLDVNLMPPSSHFGLLKKAIIMPNTMAKTALPMTGTSLPKNHAGTAITAQSNSPGAIFFIVSSTLLKNLPAFDCSFMFVLIAAHSSLAAALSSSAGKLSGCFSSLCSSYSSLFVYFASGGMYCNKMVQRCQFIQKKAQRQAKISIIFMCL